jgi:F420-0:gamma-glutamyl ligase
MQVQALKSRIIKPGDKLLAVIDEIIATQLNGQLPDNSVVAISSKIVSYCQGRLVKKAKSQQQGFSEKEGKAEKHALVQKEAELFTQPHSSKYDLMLTIKASTLAVNAGIDESNASLNGKECFVLWPEKIQETVNEIWRHLRQKYKLQNFGVIITDSRSFPLRWGVVGTTIAYCGFKALNNHIGQTDLFSRKIKMVQVNVAEALGVAATFEMGEVKEATPVVLLTDLAKVQFVHHPPSQSELENNKIALEDDVYAPLLTNASWHKGGAYKAKESKGKRK